MPYNKSAGSNPVTAMGNSNFSAKASYSRSPVIEHTCPAANSPSILHSGSWAKNDMAAGMVNKEVSKDRLVIFRETISCNSKVYRGVVVSNPMAKKTTCFSGFSLAIRNVSRGE